MQTLNHVKGDLQWIVVEDAADCSKRVRNLVQRKFAVEEGRVSNYLIINNSKNIINNDAK